jgi:protein-S-isoprenylcysteine O-methyltransferase Ste14
MRKPIAAGGTTAFFVLAPGIVVGLIPWWLTGWRAGEPLPYWIALRVFGIVLLALGFVVLIQSFVQFAAEGSGTPAPVAPTESLVVGGLYRHVRNPMYLAVVVTILGQAFALGRPVLLLYAAIVAGAFVAFVHWYEEPALRRRFGAEYETYRRAVPAWLPRPRARAPSDAERR